MEYLLYRTRPVAMRRVAIHRWHHRKRKMGGTAAQLTEQGTTTKPFLRATIGMTHATPRDSNGGQSSPQCRPKADKSSADALVHNAPGNETIIKNHRTPNVDVSTVNIILLAFGPHKS